MKKMLLLAVAAMMMLPAAAQEGEAYPSYIQVTGRAEREVEADRFDLSITIDERDSKGKTSIEEQQREMISALKRLGIDTDKCLTMADVGSSFYKRDSAVASAAYMLRLESAAQVSGAWQALSALGISKVELVKMDNSQIEKIRNEVRIEAMKNARDVAAALAGAVGQGIGRCFYIQDWNNTSMIRYNTALEKRSRNLAADFAAEESAAGNEMEFKAMKLTYEVQAKFVLE